MTDGIFTPIATHVQVPAAINYTRVSAAVDGLNGGGFVVTYTERDFGTGMPEFDDVYFQLFNADGTANGSPVLVNTTTGDHQRTSSVAVLNDGTFVITWTDFAGTDGDGTGIYMQRFDAAGVAQGVETLVNTSTAGDQDSPDTIALSGGGYAIVWHENVDDGMGNVTSAINMQKFTAAGVADGGEITIASEVATGSISYTNPEIVELSGGNLGVSWTRYDTTTNAFPQFSIVTSAGVAVAGPINPEQTSDDPFTLPQIRLVELGNGNLLATWIYSYDGTGAVNVGYGEVYGRIYDASGNAVGNEFAIATGTENRRFDLFASSDGDGGAMVGFVQEDDSENERALLIQNISQNGDLVGDQIWANQNQGGQWNRGEIGVLSNGDLVTVFQDSGGGAVSKIWTQRISNGEDGRFTTGDDNVMLLNTGESVAALEGADTVTGGTGDDVISGGSGIDTIDGGDGSDTIDGGADGDILDGEGDDDFIFGRAGDDTINGGTGNDVIDGGRGDDTIHGDDNDDDLFGGYGSDTIHGGDGADNIYGYRSLFTDLGPDDPDRDVDLTNFLFGDGGDDFIYGGNGIDIINGGEGDDRAFGSRDNNSIDDDTFIASNGDDLYNGNGGVDLVDYSNLGGAITASLGGGPLAVTIAPNGLNPQYRHTLYQIENIIGTDFADDITGDDNDNEIEGGDGDDIKDGGIGSDTASYAGATAGVTVDLSTQGVSQNTVGAGTDTLSNFENLRGSGQNDTLTGDGNDNVIEGGNGADILDGGSGGVNTASYRNSSTGVEVGLNGAGTAGDANGDTLTGFNNLWGSDQDDTLTGDANDNELFGHDGDDILNGGDGDDLLDGGAHGSGGDTADYNDAGSGIRVLLADTNGQNTLGSGRDTHIGIENLIGSAFDDSLYGDDFDNVLEGGDGADRIVAGDGNDTLRGGEGNDILKGRGGDDMLFGDGGDDIMFADEGVDTLDGGADNDFLYGGSSNDTLHGGSGDDVLRGNLNNDILNGDDGLDTLLGGGQNDTLNGGNEADTLAGENGDDTLNGDAGDDNLNGNAGLDILDGGSGDDVLRGETEADIFVFKTGNEVDRIRDWEDGIDMIDLTSYGFVDATTALGFFSQVGANVRFIDGPDILIIENEILANITAADIMI